MPKMPDSIEVDGFPVTLLFVSGRIFFCERVTGRLWEVLGEEDFRLVRQFTVLPITGHHETGLLGIAADPNFKENNFLYAFYTAGETLGKAENKVVRFRADEGSTEETLISGIPANRIHNGGIIGFGPDGKIYVLVGVDNPVMKEAQKKESLAGKVLRLNPDGSIPEDNPFGDAVYTYGHRNLFGLAFHPLTGDAFVSEPGPDRDDEINILVAGGNYGWPEVTGSTRKEEFIDPIITYTPTITPTQGCFWENDFYFGSYNDGKVRRLKLQAPDYRTVESEEIVYQGKPFGIIGVFVSPRGDFYVATPNRISRFDPSLVKEGDSPA